MLWRWSGSLRRSASYSRTINRADRASKRPAGSPQLSVDPSELTAPYIFWKFKILQQKTVYSTKIFSQNQSLMDFPYSKKPNYNSNKKSKNRHRDNSDLHYWITYPFIFPFWNEHFLLICCDIATFFGYFRAFCLLEKHILYFHNPYFLKCFF